MKDKDISFQSLMDKNIKQIEKALNQQVKTSTPDNDEKHEKAISEGYFKDSSLSHLL